jgi:chemotaxis protein CheD
MMGAHSHHEVYINPGDFYFGEGDIRVSTLLGSCVALVLWHPLRRHGGMCHYMLDSRGVILDHLDGRYADEAMELFMVELNQRKTHPTEYQVKIFGGGSLLEKHGKKKGEEGMGDVGVVNIEAAHHLLDRYGFKIVAENVGGSGHRRIMFDLWNGDVWMRFQEA